MTPAAVVTEARTWLGTRFRHQACVKGVGVDCIGLVAGVADALGMPEAKHWLADARRRAYTREPDAKMLISAADEYLVPVPLLEMREGDIALMRIAREPQHFGIITTATPRYMIHAHAPSRKVVETGFGPWFVLLLRAYRYRALI